MSKKMKIILGIVLAIIIIIIGFFIFGFPHNEVGEPNIYDEVLTGSEEEIVENVPTFEEDVMNDLESYFSSNKGYEDVEGEYGFIDAEAE